MARNSFTALRYLSYGVVFSLTSHNASLAQELLYAKGNEFASHTEYGYTVAVLSDIDQDGALDVAVGEPDGGIVGGAVHVLSGATGLELYTVQSLQPNGQLGRSLARLGDLNSDGIDEFVAGAPSATSLLGVNLAGKITVVSGATGASLFEVYGTVPSEGFGSQVGAIGDVNMDGVPDILVSTPAGVVHVLSGAGGSLLYTKTGPVADRYGWSLLGLPDLDLDGRADFAVGAPSFPSANPGYVDILSGATGTLIRTLVGDSNNDSFGLSLAMIDDLDGDLVADVIVGAPKADNPSLNYGTVWIYSAASGAVIRQLDGPSSNSDYGWAVASTGDVTGDGIADFIAGAPDAKLYANNRTGAAWVHSGADGSIVFVLAGLEANERFGAAVGTGDMNGDGTPDFAIGSPEADLFSGGGDVRAYSGTCANASANYCQATTNSLGCIPWIQSNGALSLSGSDDFELVANDVIPGKPSMFFWGIAPWSVPFSDGPYCVGNGVARTTVGLTVNMGGGSSCPGTRSYSFQQNYVQSFGFEPGVTLFAQFWYRDPAQVSPAGAGLTDGLRFWFCP